MANSFHFTKNRCVLRYGLITLIVAATLQVFLASACHVCPSIRTTRLGTITGTRSTLGGSSIEKYLGIPYAKPPVGKRRLKKPESYGRFGDLNATEFGHICPQLRDGEIIGNEDCLTLNIYVPVTITLAKTVMIWIHGGSFLTGAALETPAEVLALDQDVIVVNINYRLNILGFLSTGDSKLPGNYGLWDQRMAIKWVRDNINDYGGDSTSITIFGESAGARATSFQMLSPRNDKTLFQRVVAESGSAFSLTYLNRDPTEVLNHVKEVTGCAVSSYYLQCIQNLPLEILMNANRDVARPFPFYPIVDGDFLPYDLGHVNANFTVDPTSVQRVIKHAGQYDLLAGWNNQEGLIYLGRLNGISRDIDGHDLHSGVSDQVLTRALEQYPFYKYGGYQNSIVIELFKSFYLKQTDYNKASDGRSLQDQRVEAYMDIAGDVALKVPVLQLLQIHSSLEQGLTYGYEFRHKKSWAAPWYDGPDWLKIGADHTDEIPYVFGWPFLDAEKLSPSYLAIPTSVNFTQEERNFSKRIMTYWGKFAKTGKPGDFFNQFNFATTQDYTKLTVAKEIISHFPLNDRQRLWSAVDAAVISTQKPDVPTSSRLKNDL